VESFLAQDVDVRISLDPRFGKIRELTTGLQYSGKPAGGGFGVFGTGSEKRMVYPIQIKPHSYRVFAAMEEGRSD
jgi:hypothetical protein